MSLRTLYLHIGPSKTGTSAIQFAAARGAGPYYPRAGRWADEAHHHIGLAGLGIERRGAVKISPLADLKKALAAEFAGISGDVLISTESLPAGGVTQFIDR